MFQNTCQNRQITIKFTKTQKNNLFNNNNLIKFDPKNNINKEQNTVKIFYFTFK